MFMKFLKFIVIIVSTTVLTSCSTEDDNPKFTEKELNEKVDSILPIKYREVESTYLADYQLRKKILIKPILDSLNKRDTTIPIIKNPTNNE